MNIFFNVIKHVATEVSF